jgi:predicted nucleotidyltransferase
VTDKDKSFLSKIKKKGQEQLVPGDKMFLYGSKARGTDNPMSDWDILILTKEQHTENDSFEKYIYPLVLFGQINNEDISVITYSQKEWENNKCSPFYQNVMRDRIQLI